MLYTELIRSQFAAIRTMYPSLTHHQALCQEWLSGYLSSEQFDAWYVVIPHSEGW